MLLMWIVAGSSLLIIVVLFATSKGDSVGKRMEGITSAADQAANLEANTKSRFAAPSILKVRPTKVRKRRNSSGEDDAKPSFRDRMVHAGIYRVRSSGATKAVRIGTFCAPVVLGVLLSLAGILTLRDGCVLGAVIGGLGVMAPSFYLDRLKNRRQTMMRRALPDALDTIIVCIEGGLSLSSAFARVANELAAAHPMLSLELKILEREVRMGRTTGEALRNMARRFDLEELRSLASVILQSERYGASVTKALNVFAESLRLRRQQRAEELAHKSAVKIMFPTVFCILPAMFIVILGPAAIRVTQTLLPTMASSMQ